ncbi:nucleotidyltransferase domain-containing protein [Desulfonatronum thiodismutans]|uniref:nucleotidyltransferase domain-containing protein n=1 Tax=Desulfonatronum thiodismutans TaxID=159290 RepID=UPI0009FF5778|nr:nucleotidyltransferase domain-containing protein [Desulfonatronum thiodismutans]
MDKEQAIALAKEYLKLVRPYLNFDNAYLFGSYAEGRQHEHSDLDIGIIVSHIDDDYLETVKNLYRIRRLLDVRIEPHLFVANNDPTGFVDTVATTGLRL